MRNARMRSLVAVVVLSFAFCLVLVAALNMSSAHAQEMGDNFTAQATIPNVAPEVGPIEVQSAPFAVGTLINFTVAFTDPGVLGAHLALWDWGDGSTSPGTITGVSDTGSVADSHAYADAGIYTVRLTVTDDAGNSAESAHEQTIVYDPNGGFVTGGGWIESPEIACPVLCEGATGKANFGFVSKYKKGATEPTGNTQFSFKAGNLNFHSSNYEWLVVAGPKAKYKGAGTINGAGNYGFMLTAVDAALTPSTDVDLFRIKIWDKDNGDVVVYDNQMGSEDDASPATAIGGGNIIVHDGKVKSKSLPGSGVEGEDTSGNALFLPSLTR